MEGTLWVPGPLLISLAGHHKVEFILKAVIFLVAQYPWGWRAPCVTGATDDYLGGRWDRLADWLCSTVANEINVVFT